MSSIHRKAVTSGAWSVSANILEKGIAFFVYILLARFIGVQEFGYVALSMLVIDFITLMIGAGIRENIVRRNECSSLFIDTCFWVLFVSGCVVSSVMLLVAGPLVDYLYSAELANVFVTLSLLPLLSSINVVQKAKLQREFDFRSLAIRSFFSTVVSGSVAIYLAMNDFGVFALVFMKYMKLIMDSTLLYVVTRYRPALQFSLEYVKEIYRFGVPLLMTENLNFWGTRMAEILISAFFGAYYLGLYDIGKKFVQSVYEIILTPMSSVGLTYFSKVKGRDREIAYTSFVTGLAMLVIPVVALIGFFSDSIVAVFLGPDWSESSTVVQYLSYAAIAQVLIWYVNPYLIAHGLTGLSFKMILWGFVVRLGVAIALIASEVSFAEFVLFYSLSFFLVTVINYSTLRYRLDFDLRAFAIKFSRVCLIAVALYFSLTFYKEVSFEYLHLISTFDHIVYAITGSFIGLIAFVFMSMLLLKQDLSNAIRNIVKK